MASLILPLFGGSALFGVITGACLPKLTFIPILAITVLGGIVIYTAEKVYGPNRINRSGFNAM